MLTYFAIVTALSALAAYAHSKGKTILRRFALGLGVFFASLPVALVGLFGLAITNTEHSNYSELTVATIFGVTVLACAIPAGYVFLADAVIRRSLKKKARSQPPHNSPGKV